MSYQLSRSPALQSIPQRKLVDALESTIRQCAECSLKPNLKLDADICKICRIRNKAIQRYYESNIPVKYWLLEMETHFHGDTTLLEKYKQITQDLPKSYKEGIAICFAGNHGLGKTMTCCNVLKRAVEKGFSGLYVNLNDIVSVMLDPGDADNKTIAKKELVMVDFLVIDEFDPRYMANDKASDLFGKIMENVFRARSQNNLPVLMCTNSPNVNESFVGPIKMSITSLMKTVTTVPVLGNDFRGKK